MRIGFMDHESNCTFSLRQIKQKGPMEKADYEVALDFVVWSLKG